MNVYDRLREVLDQEARTLGLDERAIRRIAGCACGALQRELAELDAHREQMTIDEVIAS